MILSAEELEKLVNAFARNEGFEILIKAIVERMIQEAIDKHLDDYVHAETPLTGGEGEQ